MISVPGIDLGLGPLWRFAGDSAVRGHAAVRGDPVDGDALAARLAADDLEAFMVAADGGFAAVQANPDGLVAGVDRLRSVPLFYAEHGGRVLLSDDAHWIADRLPPEPPDPVAEAEFLALGYVTGRDTLHPRIRQLLAGEILTVTANPPTVSTDRYFVYGHGPYFEEPQPALLDAWDATLERITRRLIASAAGRPIVVPLSGGLDSRLLLLELRRAGHDNVRTFTYGVPGHEEGRIAERVAGELGYPWLAVPYGMPAWRRWYRSREFEAYVRYADGLSTVAHVQDWPAVWELREAGAVPPDAIFVPGHNGGFLFGENGNVHRIKRPTLADLVSNLERVHYNNVRLRDRSLRAAMRRRLVESLAEARLDQPGGPTSAWERWEWQERQAKFMCNSMRVYEFWGYDWRMPLWDVEAIEFWQRIPLEQRARARLHRAYVARASVRAGLTLPSADRIQAIQHALTRDFIPERAKKVARRVRALFARRVYEGHPMGWYGVIEFEQFRKLYTGGETINSILALDQMGRLPPAGGR
ncbi:MAG TPA: asparagine synthase-related protein [Candidatus Limnocylindrales bacterium]|nr:asparagine synthase-related protein [Candidatus Limnocylindrales bacterium]